MKHEGIFGGLIVTLGDTEYHGLEILAHLELRRTDQIPHVLHHKKVQVFEAKFSEGIPDHVAIKMTGATRIDLHHGNASLGDALRVLGRLDISLYHSNAQVIFQGADAPFKKRGLAGPG